MATSTSADRARPRSTLRAVLAACAFALAPAVAVAEPLRLRGDAFATAETPAGLMILEASDRARPWLHAEASVWFGAGPDTQADALVIVVNLRDPRGRGSLRVGRQIVAAGALRPVHLDGGEAMVRLPGRASLELFGGIPVEPSLGTREWDWVVGARAGKAVGRGQIGLAFVERHDFGELATRELAADAATPIGERIDLGAGVAFDLVGVGFAEVRASGAWRGKRTRLELFGTRRSPAHLLPATSLFSVLGDVPATRAGATARWRVAPRLDVDGTAALRITGGGVDEDLTAGARLRLDDRGASSLGLELRRQGAPDGSWTGARGTGRLALPGAWAVSTELELVVPDDDARGSVWPWALGAVSWRPGCDWELAGAVEASATPQYSSRVDVLFRLSRAWAATRPPERVTRRGALARRGVP